MKDFLNIDEQIEENKRVLEFYHTSYQRTQSKISILFLIYSVIAIYIIQIIKYPFEFNSDISLITTIIYYFVIIGFIITLFISIYYTYLLLKPVEVAYLHSPKYYYNDIKSQYEDSLDTKDGDTINAYLKITILDELEIAIEKNCITYETKCNYYSKAFKSGILSALFYLVCAGFVFFKEDAPQKIDINNYKEILLEINSLKN